MMNVFRRGLQRIKKKGAHCAPLWESGSQESSYLLTPNCLFIPVVP